MKNILILTFLFPFLFIPASRAQAPPAPGSGECFVYPMPVTGNGAYLAYNMAEAGTIHILLFNEAGDSVGTSTESKPAGLQTSLLNTCCMAPGLYFCLARINYASGSRETLRVSKFVVVRP